MHALQPLSLLSFVKSEGRPPRFFSPQTASRQNSSFLVSVVWLLFLFFFSFFSFPFVTEVRQGVFVLFAPDGRTLKINRPPVARRYPRRGFHGIHTGAQQLFQIDDTHFSSPRRIARFAFSGTRIGESLPRDVSRMKIVKEILLLEPHQMQEDAFQTR